MDRPSPVPTSPDAKWVLVSITGNNTLDVPPKGAITRKDVGSTEDSLGIGGKMS